MRAVSVTEFAKDDGSRARRDRNTVGILSAYFDDSGDAKRERYSAVGGLIGSDDQWLKFDILWMSATRALKRPFRSVECECQHGQFKECSVERCRELMTDLVGIIKTCRLGAFASVVPIPDYRSNFSGSDEYDPYLLALRHTIINMAQVGSLSPYSGGAPAGIKIWLEDSSATAGRSTQAYTELKAVRAWKNASVLKGFTVGSKAITGLQAADIIAREAFKYAANRAIRPTRKPVKRLKDAFGFHLWTGECLEYLSSIGGPRDTRALTSWGQKGPKPPQMIRLFRDFPD